MGRILNRKKKGREDRKDDSREEFQYSRLGSNMERYRIKEN